MRLGIDLDGVLFPFDENFKEYCLKIGEDIPDDAKADCWDFFKEWGISTPRFIEICDQGVDDEFIFLKADPYPDSIETLWRLNEEGHSIHIITHRMFGSRSAHNTFDWLFEHNVPFDSVTFSEDKTFIGVDLLLDDRKENYLSSVEAGIPGLLYDRPWNSDLNVGEDRVCNWQEFYDILNSNRFQ